MKEIECIINPDGTIELDFMGFRGKACEKVATELIKTLGTQTSSKVKDEYYEREVEKEKNQIRRL